MYKFKSFFVLHPRLLYISVMFYHYVEAHTVVTSWQHQRHCPAHKSRNLARAVCIILTVQYQQKPSSDTVKSQCTARCRPRSNNKLFNVGEFVLYMIYGTRVVVSWRDAALGFASCCISHSTTPLVP